MEILAENSEPKLTEDREAELLAIEARRLEELR